MSLLAQVSTAVTAAGVAAVVIGFVRGFWRAGLGLALDLWVAAGLLRLSSVTSGTSLAGVAVIIVVRHVVSAGLRPAAATGVPARR
jgi:hypothetical protein